VKYLRMPIEIESPEELGYSSIECNLTESSYTDFRFKDLGLDLSELTLAYDDHRGNAELRRSLSASTGSIIEPDRVLLTSGAAGALFIISTTLLAEGDELVVVRPNYATNLETPRAIGARVVTLDLTFEDGYRIDPQRLAELITPQTKLVSITVPHNPTGSSMTADEVREVVEITRAKGCYLLVDETYREMNFTGVLPYAATLGDHVISVASLSKTFGLPGIRVGWLMTADAALSEQFLAAKEQIQICGSTLDEEIAARFVSRRDEFLPQILTNIRRRFEIVRTWIEGPASEFLEWVEPTGGCVSFPRFTDAALRQVDLDRFATLLNGEFNTYVGPGHWFEQEARSFRLGYGWPGDDELKQGLERIVSAARASSVG
jgi:aspartate/methionine/tyrosine aminotransferase